MGYKINAAKSLDPPIEWGGWLIRCTLVVLIASAAGILHCIHVSQLHENDYFFSHLSSKERELTFATESGFYYSYFKQVIMAPDLITGWYSLLKDTRTEVPRVVLDMPSSSSSNESHKMDDEDEPPLLSNINAIQRFNLYPEFGLAVAYRLLQPIKWLLRRECYEVKRDTPDEAFVRAVKPELFVEAVHNGTVNMMLSPLPSSLQQSVMSCVGSEEPAYFYVNFVFLLAGLTPFAMACAGWFVAANTSSRLPSANGSGALWLSVWGALLPVVGFFANHGEATRVQWNAPLRENFAYPYFVLQQAWLLYSLRQSHTTSIPSRLNTLIYCLLLLGFQLPWQFAQFALATQIAALFLASCLTVASSIHCREKNGKVKSPADESVQRLLSRVHFIVGAHLVALVLNYVLQMGNNLLLSSGYPAGLVGVFVGLWALRKQVSAANRIHGTTGQSSDHASRYYQPLRCLLWPIAVTLGVTVCPGLMLTRLIFFASSEANDGGHIVDLLLEKFGLGSRTFHTGLYTCSAAFDFIRWDSLLPLIHTGILPLSALLACWVLIDASLRLFSSLSAPRELIQCSNGATKPPSSSNQAKRATSPQLASLESSPSLRRDDVVTEFISLFVVLQLGFFTLMAGMIMRLKLFWTPQLCISLSLLAQSERWNRVMSWMWKRRPVVGTRGQSSPAVSTSTTTMRWYIPHTVMVVFLAFLMFQGEKHLQTEWRVRGQFSAYQDEAMIDWFNALPDSPLPKPRDGKSHHSPRPWVISGPMSVLGNLRLMLPASPPYPTTQRREDGRSVGFAFTNHPHYESAQLRARTILAYSIYRRLSVEQVWRIYHHQLRANFVIMDPRACRPQGGCSNPQLFDLMEPELRGQPSVCEFLLHTSDKNRVPRTNVTPPGWGAYFHVVYLDTSTGRVVLYVRPETRNNTATL